jgi:hypothetical protein
LAGRYLANTNPQLGKLANALSITIGFHKHNNAKSEVAYTLSVDSRKSCYAMYSVLKVRREGNGARVTVPLVFGVVTDGKVPSPPCNPRTGVCVDSTNPWGREGD